MSRRDLLDLLKDRYDPPELVEKLNIDPDIFMGLLGDYILDNLWAFEDDLGVFFESS